MIGQNIGTATSSARRRDRRLEHRQAARCRLYRFQAGRRADRDRALSIRDAADRPGVAQTIDATALLAAYHTAYNVIGVAVLLPLMGPFTRLIERLVPERGSPFTKYLDPASLRSPMVAVEAVRRTIERALETLCGATASGLDGAAKGGTVRPALDEATRLQASDGVRQASDFLSKSDPPPSEEGHAWFTSTVHALDHASRLAEAVDAMARTGVATDGPEELSAAALCAGSMRDAAGGRRESRGRRRTGATRPMTNWLDNRRTRSRQRRAASRRRRTPELERAAKALADLRRRASQRDARDGRGRQAHRRPSARARRRGRAHEPARASRMARCRASRSGRRLAPGAPAMSEAEQTAWHALTAGRGGQPAQEPA